MTSRLGMDTLLCGSADDRDLGGMNFSNVPEMVRGYGRDVMFLIGGALHKSGPDLVKNCHQLRSLVTEELKVIA